MSGDINMHCSSRDCLCSTAPSKELPQHLPAPEASMVMRMMVWEREEPSLKAVALVCRAGDPGLRAMGASTVNGCMHA